MLITTARIKKYDTMAAFGSPFRLYRRQEIVLPGGNMKSILMAGACLLIASIASISAQAATISISYSFTGGPTGPPVVSGTTLILDGLDTGSILSGNSSLNALWNPVTFRDHSVAELTTGLLNGTFSITFANGNMLSGNLFEDVTAVVATGMGPFTQRLTFTGGTGMFAGASGSASGGGVAGPTGFVSGSGTLTAPGISSVPEPTSGALIFGGLLVMVASRKRVRQLTRQYQNLFTAVRLEVK